MPSQNAIRLMGRESFEWSEPLFRDHMRRNQQMHVIRHHHEGVQLVTMKPSFTVPDGIDRDLRDFVLPEENRTLSGPIQQAIHGNEGLSRGAASRRKNAALWKTSRKPKCDEHGAAHGIPMRQATFVSIHREDGGFTE